MQSLLSRFTAYLRAMDSVEEIDTLPEFKSLAGQQIADYFCKSRQIIIEQKCVTVDQSAKIQKLIEEKLDKKYLNFYGTRELQEILAEVPNGDEINREVYQAATRLLES
jgi:transcriptional regulator of NAD metabolism